MAAAALPSAGAVWHRLQTVVWPYSLRNHLKTRKFAKRIHCKEILFLVLTAAEVDQLLFYRQLVKPAQ